jgi:hypothetical protein
VISFQAGVCGQMRPRAGCRQGRKLGFPRFKGKRHGMSCRFTTGAFGLAEDRRHVKLPRIGVVRTHKSTRKLARHVGRGTARIRSAIMSYRAGGGSARSRWRSNATTRPRPAGFDGGRVPPREDPHPTVRANPVAARLPVRTRFSAFPDRYASVSRRRPVTRLDSKPGARPVWPGNGGSS